MRLRTSASVPPRVDQVAKKLECSGKETVFKTLLTSTALSRKIFRISIVIFTAKIWGLPGDIRVMYTHNGLSDYSHPTVSNKLGVLLPRGLL